MMALNSKPEKEIYRTPEPSVRRKENAAQKSRKKANAHGDKCAQKKTHGGDGTKTRNDFAAESNIRNGETENTGSSQSKILPRLDKEGR